MGSVLFMGLKYLKRLDNQSIIISKHIENVQDVQIRRTTNEESQTGLFEQKRSRAE